MREPLFDIQAATVVRDGRVILAIDQLEIRSDERIAVLGPNGAGKSTLLAMLAGDVLPVRDDTTRVLVAGEPRMPLFERRRLFGYVSDILQEEYRRPVRVLDAVLSGAFGSIGLYRRSEVTPAMLERAHELIEEVGIAHLMDRTLDTLSTGEMRRTLIARALVHEPRMLVLDEPCDGLDLAARYAFHRTIERLAASRGIVLVTHHVEDIVPAIERVVLLRDGCILADGPKRDVLTAEQLSALHDVPVEVEERDGVYRLWWHP